jgi:c-di-GMP-related signal transduction protein
MSMGTLSGSTLPLKYVRKIISLAMYTVQFKTSPRKNIISAEVENTAYLASLINNLNDAILTVIETKQQFDYLIAKGCNLIQEYYLSKPLDIDDWAALQKTNGTAIEDSRPKLAISNVVMFTI